LSPEGWRALLISIADFLIYIRNTKHNDASESLMTERYQLFQRADFQSSIRDQKSSILLVP